MLILIPYESEIGFAIGRLLRAFFEMATVVSGGTQHVHVAFSRVGAPSTALPSGFRNVVEFDCVNPSKCEVNRLCRYIADHGITSVFALDLAVEAPWLRDIRKAGIRRVVSYWGAPMSSINRGLKLAAKRAEVAWLRPNKPDHFIFESEAMRQLAVNGRGVAAAATTVAPSGVDITDFQSASTPTRVAHERFGIPESRRIIVYMGHLHRRKGVHVLMEAAGYLVRKLLRDDIHILFLGNRDGEEREFEESLRDGRPIITLGGYHEDVPLLLSSCYAGCIPSTGWDSFPMSSLEMQASGLPVLVSDWQGTPETVSDGETGIVVPVGNVEALARAIAELVDDPARRDTMGRAARERISNGFTRDHQVERLVACLRSIP